MYPQNFIFKKELWTTAKKLMFLSIFTLTSFSAWTSEHLVDERLSRAKQGDSQAQYTLGLMYLFGVDVEKNASEAKKWLHLSAQQENSQAHYVLGWMHLNGFGVEQNYSEAAKLFRFVSSQGESAIIRQGGSTIILSHAQHSLGWMYYYGIGVEENVSEAENLFRLAADRGYAPARYFMGELEHLKLNFSQAEKWHRLAAEQNYAKSQCVLAEMLYYGDVEQDLSQSKELFRIATEREDLSQSEKWFCAYAGSEQRSNK